MHLSRLPLNALRAFEATARHMSFKHAAEELHVTPAALSYQIRTLEELLEVRLFDRMNRKIRQGQQMQVPYLLIVGDQEMADGTVSVRRRDGKREQGVGVDGFITAVSHCIQSRSPEL